MPDPVEFTPDPEVTIEGRGDYTFLTISVIVFVICWTLAFTEKVL